MNSADRISSHDRLQSGVSLVEVLVALVVISVGLLGIAALQAISLRDTTSSVVRSQATALTDYIIDRMRANRPRAGDYVVALDAHKARTDRAGNDVEDWKDLLAANRADGSIEINGNVVTVTVAWGERETVRDAADPDDPGIAALEFVTSTEI